MYRNALQRLALFVTTGAVLAILFPSALLAAEDPVAEGIWQGALQVPNGRLRLVVRIERDAAGQLSGTLESVDQGSQAVKIDRITLAADVLSFQIDQIGGGFEGSFVPAGNQVSGTWSQSGARLPLTLSRGLIPMTSLRPQDPVPPLPYIEQQASYDSAPGVKLAATFTLPPGAGPFPAVVLLTGSGAQDRDEALAGHRPFAVLADALARRGIAVLRADDRGTAASSGDFASATSPDFAQDALAGVRFLLQRPEVDGSRIGLIGHSEGGIVAPYAATRDQPESSRIAFIVMLAGPGERLGDTIIAQQRANLGPMGAVATVDARIALTRQIIALLLSTPDKATAAGRLRNLLTDFSARLPEPQRSQFAGRIEAQMAQWDTPWRRWLLAYDPAPTLRELRVPVLALFGEKDLQVQPAQNRPLVEAALKDAARGTEVRVLPGLNHLFQTAGTGHPDEYAQIQETFSPAALQLIGDWVLQRESRR